MTRKFLTVMILTVLLATTTNLFAAGKKEAVTVADDGLITVRTVRLHGGNQVYYDGDTVEENIWTRFLRDKFNIQLEHMWVVTGTAADFEQRLNLSVLSGDVPDWFSINRVETYRDFASAGHLFEVSDVFDRVAAPEVKHRLDVLDGILWRAMSVNGRNYSIPSTKFKYQDNKVLWVRQDWLDKLNLEAPTTYAEMYAVAQAFATRDPNGTGRRDTIAFAFDNSIMSWMASLDPFFGMFGAMPGTWLRGIWIEGPDGNLIYPGILPGAKDALAELAKWYREGLVNQDFVTQNEQALAQLVGAGNVGMYFGSPWNPSWPQPSTLENVPGSAWKAYPIPAGPTGSRAHFDTPVIAAPGIVFGANFAHVDRVMEVINWNIVEQETPRFGEFQREYAIGRYFENDPDNPGYIRLIPGREIHVFADAGFNDPYRYTRLIEAYDAGLHLDIANKNTVPSGVWGGLNELVQGPEYANALRIVSRDAEHALVDQYAAATSGPVHARTWGFLSSLERETFAKIIMGELPVSAFDSFVTEWRRSGGDDLAREVNEWWRTAR